MLKLTNSRLRLVETAVGDGMEVSGLTEKVLHNPDDVLSILKRCVALCARWCLRADRELALAVAAWSHGPCINQAQSGDSRI